MGDDAAAAVEAVFQADRSRIVATLIGLLGDFDLAEEYAQEAFTAALRQWPATGVPALPRAWIVQTARNKAIDHFRRQQRFAETIEPSLERELQHAQAAGSSPGPGEAGDIPDERLRLIFTCCHPAVPPDAQVALTLRTLCGLETGEIARAFLVPEVTMAQRLVRAKRRIRELGIPYAVPEAAEMEGRLQPVLTTIYLTFNEGYTATRGERLMRVELCGEAIRLGGLLRDLMAPSPPAEVTGLLALMLLTEARREARTDAAGEIVPLEEQDRSRWNRAHIAAGLPLAAEATAVPAPGRYALEAAIAAEHARAASAAKTDWRRILALYDHLLALNPSPVLALNRAVALAMTGETDAALAAIAVLESDGGLGNYHLLHAARADLLRRRSAHAAARASYARALALAVNARERIYLERRLRELPGPDNAD